MMHNNFVNAPTAGSHDNTTYEELHERIRQLEQRLTDAEAQQQTSKGSKKIKWKKIKKFFKTVITPILTFIPNLINAIAGYKKTFDPAR